MAYLGMMLQASFWYFAVKTWPHSRNVRIIEALECRSEYLDIRFEFESCTALFEKVNGQLPPAVTGGLSREAPVTAAKQQEEGALEKRPSSLWHSLFSP